MQARFKVLIMLLILIMISLLAGCNIKKKIGESITKGIMEEIGEDENLDIDYKDNEISFTTDEGEVTFGEDGYVFEGNDGEVVTYGSTNEWPQGMAADSIPKLDAGVIDYVMNSELSCMLTINEISEEEYLAYKEKVVDAGFTEQVSTMEGEDGDYYFAFSGKTYINVYYYYNDKSLSITLAIEEE